MLEWLSTPGVNSCAMCRVVVFEEDADDEVDHWAGGDDYLDSDPDSEFEAEDEDDDKGEDEDDQVPDVLAGMEQFLGRLESLGELRATHDLAERIIAKLTVALGFKYNEELKEILVSLILILPILEREMREIYTSVGVEWRPGWSSIGEEMLKIYSGTRE